MSNNLSIKDIGRMAGVSIATVSRVINKNGKVAKDTEKKILKVMEENNYVPNLLAKGFRTRKSTVIGIVVPDIANEFFSRIAQKVQMLFFEKGYATIIWILILFYIPDIALLSGIYSTFPREVLV